MTLESHTGHLKCRFVHITISSLAPASIRIRARSIRGKCANALCNRITSWRISLDIIELDLLVDLQVLESSIVFLYNFFIAVICSVVFVDKGTIDSYM